MPVRCRILAANSLKQGLHSGAGGLRCSRLEIASANPVGNLTFIAKAIALQSKHGGHFSPLAGDQSIMGGAVVLLLGAN